MSDPVVFPRRDFLKLAGIGALAAAGCAQPPAERLIPYLIPPNDVLPGIPYWYASTCRECPAGCGILVKQREGRVVKLEGNPRHPVNRGGLCARGHAGLQAAYDPDRLKTPQVKQGGAWKAVTWDEALRLGAERLGAARGKIAVLTGNSTGSLHRLCETWAAAAGGTHLVYEAFAHESLREANRRTFGQAVVPHFDFARARLLLSLGADFLETWGSPVGYGRDFASLRARADGGAFVAVEPRLSMTGANADEWVAIRPGGEMALALGLAREILDRGLGSGPADRGVLLDLVAAYTPEAVEQQTDVPAETVRRLARAFAADQPSLAVAGGIGSQSEQAVALLAAVNLLNYVAGNVGETVRFDRTLSYEQVAAFTDVQRLITAMGEGNVDALVVHGANPAYSVPDWAGFNSALDKVTFKIALTQVMDETAERCDLILPVTHALESLGDAETVRGVHSIVQPGMQRLPMFDARPAGDVLIALATGAGFGAQFPSDWASYVKGEWKSLHARLGAGRDFDTFWAEARQNGGVWEEVPPLPTRWLGSPVFAAPELKGVGDMALVLYPSLAFYDGRGANKPWLQELPDPTSKVVWGSWVEIHPETAGRLGIATGDPVKIETEAGSLELPAYLYAGLRKDTVAIPLGQGHTAYGRYATGRGVNALGLLSPAQDQASGAVAYLSAKAKVTKGSKGSKAERLFRTQREPIQAGRGVAQVIPVSALSRPPAGPPDSTVVAPSEAALPPPAPVPAEHAIAGHLAAAEASPPHYEPSQSRPGRYTEPRQARPGEKIPAHAVTAFEAPERVRSPRQIPVDRGSYANAQHRWAMAIDLNSCTGCSACVVACHSENNVPMVGPEMIKRGREMHWIRIERFEEKVGASAGGGPVKNDVRFVPMMCQHCGDAPCETVCPVYATYHNPEGLNAQVYNRCVGTRYCSNNCPYKVRAFNFFDYASPEKESFAFPEPLNWQLNPDVTVRSKGVMEKCTMCVQRILEGKGNAKDEGRAVRDGEIQTACAQSCPTQAIVFGDLLDPESQVSKLSHGERRYWVLEELNTKPGVTYLKKLERESV
jgi:molybdopterin-containing oxidoreductase family iron-sulfur binding subunit